MFRPSLRMIFAPAVFFVLVSTLAGCGGSSGGDSEPVADLTGGWKFVLQPHPGQELGSEAVNTEVQQVQLRQNGNDLEGEYSTFIFHGNIDGNQVRLDGFHGDSDGNEYETVNMDLKVTNPDLLEGEGVSAFEDSKHDGGAERFMVRAERIPAASPATERKKINVSAEDVCSAIDSLASAAIGYITGNKFRPMGGCWLQKNGGGFYAFGETGPGSMTPIYTQTMYQPIEWAACSTRTYHFTMESRDTVRSVDLLMDYLEAEEALYKASGFSSADALSSLITDFYQTFGDFAVSAAYNTNTGNMSLYINVRSGVSTDAVYSHPMVGLLNSTLSALGNVTLLAGSEIKDTFQLRRSPAPYGPCNTPLFIVYLFGTMNVFYN